MGTYFVSGDIGGTKTLLQAAEWLDGNVHVRCERRYASREYLSFSDVLRDFLGATSALGMKPPAERLFRGGRPDHRAGHQADQFALADECDGAGA